MLVAIGVLLVTGVWNDIDGAAAGLGQRLHPGGLSGRRSHRRTCRPRPVERGATRPPTRMRPVELARWAWRQLTSMRTALVLLFLLALAVVPGSLVPQRGVDPVRVAQFRPAAPASRRRGTTGSRCSTSSPRRGSRRSTCCCSSRWSAACSRAAGCTWSAMRARPPRAPRNLARLPVHTSWSTEAGSAGGARLAPSATLRRRQRYPRRPWRTDSRRRRDAATCARPATCSSTWPCSVLLVAVAIGHLFGYKGNVLVVEGEAFSNTRLGLRHVRRTARASPTSRMPPFTVDLKKLTVRYQPSGDQRGAPRDFQAHLSLHDRPGRQPRSYDLQVNHPLIVDGTKVFLIGNGYAPVFTVRDSNGKVVFSGPVPFLPRDAQQHVDRRRQGPGARPKQLGFEGLFLPTAAIDPQLGPISTYPRLELPRAVLNAYVGDLGLDSGAPQSVYRLDTNGHDPGQERGRQAAGPGAGPGRDADAARRAGQRSRFDGVRRFATLQVAHDPGKSARAGLRAARPGRPDALAVRARRRVWVRAARRRRRAYARRGRGPGAHRGRGRDRLADEVTRSWPSSLGTEQSSRRRPTTRTGDCSDQREPRAPQQQPALLRDGRLRRRHVLLRRRARVRRRGAAPGASLATVGATRVDVPSSRPSPAMHRRARRRRRVDEQARLERADRLGRIAVSLTVPGLPAAPAARSWPAGSRPAGRRGATCTSSRRRARSPSPGSSSCCCAPRRADPVRYLGAVRHRPGAADARARRDRALRRTPSSWCRR